jgi:hypothetical protein
MNEATYDQLNDETVWQAARRRQMVAEICEMLPEMEVAGRPAQAWVVVFQHARGLEAWPRFGAKPTEASEINRLKAGGAWTGPEAGDLIDIAGPFPMPAGTLQETG